jgi:hypothetical protein
MNDDREQPPTAPAAVPLSVHPAARPVLGYQTPRSGGTVTVAWCGDAGEAELICGELRDAGVPAVAVNHHTSALGPYAGGSEIEVQVPAEDRQRAAEVLARLPDRNDVEPEEEPADGSADYTTGEDGQRVPLEVLAECVSAQEMMDLAATLGAARVQTFLPDLVPRRRDGRASGDAGEGAAGEAERPAPVFRVRVLAEDAARARKVIEEARAEEREGDEPRCPQCASWRVHKRGPGLFAWLSSLFGGAGPRAGAGETFQCLSCGFRWENPKAFQVVVSRVEAGAPNPAKSPPATGR